MLRVCFVPFTVPVVAVLCSLGCAATSGPSEGAAITPAVAATAGVAAAQAAGRAGSVAGASGATQLGAGAGRAGLGDAARAALAGAVAAGSGAAGQPGGTTSGAAGAATAGSSGVAAAGKGGVSGAPDVAGAGPRAGVSGPLFPAPDSQDVCVDPQLRISFEGSGAPKLGSSGKLQVFDVAQPGSAVATVDFGASSIKETIGGLALKLERQVFVDDNSVFVRLPARALSYGHTYYVTLEGAAITGPNGAAKTFSGDQAWRFSTRAAAPSNPSALRVALDGTGDFCSVQGALDALPAGNETPSVITLGRGTYYELIHLASKNNVTLRGEDRKGSVIAGTNNEKLNPGTATRALVGIDKLSGLVIENLTIHNLTPQGGSQAEALRMQNCDRCIVRDADILSLQDTLLWSGRVYAHNCYIAGNVDFIWGTGSAYFDQCEIKTVVRSGYLVQARNGAGAYGYVFVDSKLTSDPGLTGSTLARVDASVYPGSQVAYINCQMGSHIAPAGWTVTGGPGGGLRFAEYQTTDLSGKPLDVSRRLAGSMQLSASAAMMMRDPATVLGGWTPQ